MRAIINMARLHLTLAFQDRATWIQAFAVPVVIMFILSAAIPDGSVEILLDIVDNDQSAASHDFITQLENSGGESETIIVCVYGSDDNPVACELNADDDFNADRVKDGDAAATIVIPQDFGTTILSGQTVQIDYLSSDQFNSPTIARTVVETAVNRYGSSILIATIGTDVAAEEFDAYQDDAERQSAFTTLLQSAHDQTNSPLVRVKQESSRDEAVVGTGSRQSVPGMGSMFVLFSLLSLSQFLVEERNQGTLYRLFTVPTAKVNIVLGKILGAFTFGFLQFMIFIAFGTLIDINWGDDFLAVIVLVAAYCMAGTALGFALATLVRTTDQAAGIVTLMGLTLAPLGGAWWPLEIVPDFMKTVGHISPIAWSMDGFRELLYFNGGLVDILPMAAVLVGMSILFATFAVWRFRYE
jgi:ABC-2 type transport system permease protein